MLDVPLDSPPFPSSDWGYGGSSQIGVPDGNTDPLMTALHLTGFYGSDYRFTTAKDYLSQQLLQRNQKYGFDPVLEYLDLYFPVKEGY